MEYRSLENESPARIHECFRESFSDYIIKIQLPFDKFRRHIIRYGVDLRYSIGLYDGPDLVGFILNGIGPWKGLPTVYDAGTGIIKEYRGKKYSRIMFKTLVDEILGDRFTQYLLEVIQTNSPALNLYKKQGFVIQRELSCFKISREALISLGKLQDNSEDRWQGSRKDRSIESGFEDRKDRSNESGYEDRKDSSNESGYEDRKDSSNESGFEGRKDRSDGSEFEHRSESRKVPEIERRKDVGNDKKEVTEKGLEIEIRRIRNPHWNVLRKFWSFQPSWQNSIRSVERMGGFTIIGAYQNDQIIGYAVFDPLHGNIVQIAVDYESRGRGIGTSLMNHIIKETDGCPGLRVLNVEKTERDTMEFFTNLGFENDVDQFEMILDLRK